MGTKRILEPKVEAKGLVDVLELGLLKSASEQVLMRTPVGNGTILSAAAKGIGGGIVHSLSRNKHVQLLGSALIVDAVEDAVRSLLGGDVGGILGGQAPGGDDF